MYFCLQMSHAIASEERLWLEVIRFFIITSSVIISQRNSFSMFKKVCIHCCTVGRIHICVFVVACFFQVNRETTIRKWKFWTNNVMVVLYVYILFILLYETCEKYCYNNCCFLLKYCCIVMNVVYELMSRRRYQERQLNLVLTMVNERHCWNVIEWR